MARFQPHQGVHLYDKQVIEDVIGDFEVPDGVLFLQETDTLVRLKQSHQPRFWKICREGCHRRPFFRNTSHQWCKLTNERYNIITRLPWVKSRSKRQDHAHDYTLRTPGAATRPGALSKILRVKFSLDLRVNKRLTRVGVKFGIVMFNSSDYFRSRPTSENFYSCSTRETLTG